MSLDPHCNHRFVRDDQHTKQCLHCKGYAPVQNND
jgi:hypothetical protein